MVTAAAWSDEAKKEKVINGYMVGFLTATIARGTPPEAVLERLDAMQTEDGFDEWERIAADRMACSLRKALGLALPAPITPA